jgi:archaellum component FlaC|tara:strand:+ start:1162 stop:1518 length:357 start_codon:yes stop_codon:yes gene_type:complete
MKYIWILLLTPLLAQTTFTEAEALEMIKARDAQWEGKLAKADSLIESQKVTIADSEKLILELEEYSKIESVLSEAKSKQITLLKERDKTNEELIKTLQPKWYENQYLWLGIGFILGKI